MGAYHVVYVLGLLKCILNSGMSQYCRFNKCFALWAVHIEFLLQKMLHLMQSTGSLLHYSYNTIDIKPFNVFALQYLQIYFKQLRIYLHTCFSC